MLGWLSRRRPQRELPEYSRLVKLPTRPLPPDLLEEETGEDFKAKREIIQRELLDPHNLPGEETPLFTEFISSSGEGVVTFPLPDDGAPCLPVFSTPLRAADYKRTLLAEGPAARYLRSTATELLSMLRDLTGMGITTFALDRCPRCSIFTVTGSDSLKSPHDAIVLLAIFKATELARLQLYYGYALNAAREGRLEIAREVALECVGHVAPDDPRAHLLLGELALGLGDKTLLREAQTFLGFLKHEPAAQRLADAVRARRPHFGALDGS